MKNLLIAIALGGFFNRYRGGLFSNRDEIVARIKPEWLSKAVKFLVQGDTVNATAFGLFCALMVPHDHSPLAMFFWQLIVMFRFAAPGWGDYIGAAGGWRLGILLLPVSKPWETLTPAEQQLYKRLQEVPYIDKIIEPFLNRPRLWGVLGLSIRCGEWGLMIGAPFLNPLPALGGLLSGPILFVLSKLLPRQYIWPTFEVILGMLFWGSLLLF